MFSLVRQWTNYGPGDTENLKRKEKRKKEEETKRNKIKKKERKKTKHVEMLLWQKCDRNMSFAMFKYFKTDTSGTLHYLR